MCFIVDFDECHSPGACGSDHVCNNTVGSYACECPLGFVADSGPQNLLDPVCVGEELNLCFHLHHTAALCYTGSKVAAMESNGRCCEGNLAISKLWT